MLPRILEILRQISVHSHETAKLCSEVTAILKMSSSNLVVPHLSNTDELPQLEFLPHHVVMCDRFSYSFTPQTYLLLKNFCETENYFLSKEDVRQDVCFDEDARNGTIDACICRARKELSSRNFPCEIETKHGKGYQLILCKKPVSIQ
jgi:DNA-binding response OmpR family regulator